MNAIFLIGLMLAAEPLPVSDAESAAAPEVAVDPQPASHPVQFHPITPQSNDASKPAYQLYVESDLPLVGLALVISLGRFIHTQGAYCAPRCQAKDLNALDRVTAGFYDQSYSVASDIGFFALPAAALVMLTLDEGILPALNDFLVIAETALSATSFAGLSTLLLSRPRPFLYGDKAPLSKRNGNDAAMSFISGHTSFAFSVAVSTLVTFFRLHPDTGNIIPIIAGVVGLAGAGFVGTARVLAGNHFITDVLAGAIVGSAFGVLIPFMHKSPVQVVPSAGSEHAMVTLTGRF